MCQTLNLIDTIFPQLSLLCKSKSAVRPLNYRDNDAHGPFLCTLAQPPMQILGLNVDSVLITVALMAFSNVLPRVVYAMRMNQSHQPGSDSRPQSQPQASFLTFLRWILILHSFYISQTIFFHRPANLFTQLNLPFIAPSPLLREALLAKHPANIRLPDTTEALLLRLQSLDARSLYVRFGHDSVELCDYCHSFTDFALFALPPAALTYVRTIALVWFMTMKGSGKHRWR